jgi:hypothetical protein
MASDEAKGLGPGIHKRRAGVPKHGKRQGGKKSELRLASMAKPKHRPDGKRRAPTS